MGEGSVLARGAGRTKPASWTSCAPHRRRVCAYRCRGRPHLLQKGSFGRIRGTMGATTNEELDLDVTLNNNLNVHSPTIVHAPISCPSTSIRVAGAAFSPPRAWTE